MLEEHYRRFIEDFRCPIGGDALAANGGIDCRRGENSFLIVPAIPQFFLPNHWDVNKTDLTESLASRAGISKAEARRCIDALFDTPGGIIARALSRNEKVRITGFGILEARTRKARSGRNPRTGEKIRIAASRTAIFRAGKGLKDSL